MNLTNNPATTEEQRPDSASSVIVPRASVPSSSLIPHPSSFQILRLWLPLAVSFQLMMFEGPAFQAAIGALPGVALNLAAWGLCMSLSLIIESPVIMLLSTSIALVSDGPSFRALRKFMLVLSASCTALTALMAFTPLFELIAGGLLGYPAGIVAAAHPAMRIMLVWTAAIAWRRFYQGILVRHGQTRLVSYGTAIRLCAAVGSAIALVRHGGIPGVQVAAIAVMAAVLSEAVATTLFALPLIKEINRKPQVPGEPPLTQRAIRRFHTPLAVTTLLTLLAQPMTAAALARLAHPRATLAAWPVAFMALLVIRGGGLALQEITIAQARHVAIRPALRRFAWLLGGASMGFTLLFVLSPLLDLYLSRVIRLPAGLQEYARLAILVGVTLPLFTALGSWARGLLVAAGHTKEAYRGMGVGLTVHGLLLLCGVLMKMPGMWVAAIAMSAASAAEYVYLARRL